ncbi:hypothetical protein BT69DRAFT_1333869 [Atractiella rhizophila]|nr:hypothetical protein BT69DRAFT_1333869 [Atractiella rhizophila]
MKEKGQPVGAIFTGLWNALAHPSDEVLVSADTRKSTINLNYVHRLYQNLTPFIQIIESSFQVTAPATYSHYHELARLASKLYPMGSTFFPSRRSSQLSLGIIANASIQPHCDASNRMEGLTG